MSYRSGVEGQRPKLNLLGPIGVEQPDGALTPVRGRVGNMLLAYLAARGQAGATADDLLDAVWPDPRSRPTRSNLRLHLSRLRRSIVPAGGANPVPRVGDRYVIDTRVIDTDLQGLEETAAMLASDGAVDLDAAAFALEQWRGTPFADVDGVDVVEVERARIQALYVDAAVWWAERHTARGTPTVGVDRLRHALALSPYSERVARALVDALHHSGQSRDALNEHARFTQVLQSDVGLQPSPSFAAMAAAILDHRPSRAAAPRRIEVALHPLVDPRLEQLADHPCRGREADVEWLLEQVRDTAIGARAALVEAEAGLGKTRLVAEMASELAATTVASAYGRATGADLPYEPWTAIVRSVRRRLPGGALERLPRFVIDALAALDPLIMQHDRSGPAAAPDNHVLPGAIAELLTLASSGGPLVVIIDDLHDLDHNSTRLLLALIESELPAVTFLITTRPPHIGGQTPTRDRLIDHHAARRLAGIGPAAVGDLLLDLGEPHTVDQRDRLHRLSRGNPLILRQLAVRATTSAFIDELVSSGSTLMDVIHGSLSTLPDEIVDVLARAAVCGLDFEVDDVASMSGVSSDQIVEALQIPARRGIVTTPDADGRCAFLHAAYHQWSHELLPGPVRKRLHARLAVVEAQSDEQRVRRAWHALEARDALSVQAVLDATHAAADALSRRGGEAHLTDLVDRVVASPALLQSTLEVRLHRARALTRLGRWDDGRREFMELWEAARDADDLAMMTKVAVEIDDAGRNVRLVGHRHELLRDVIDRHSERGSASSAPAISATAEYISEAIQYGRGLGGSATILLEALAEDNLDRARALGDQGVLAAALFARSAASSWRPATEDRIAWLTEAQRLAEATGDLMRLHHVTGTLVRNHLEIGDLTRAMAAAQEHDRAARTSRHPRVVWFSKLRHAALAQMRGAFDVAAELAASMAEYGAAFALPDNDGGYGSITFMQLFHLGQLASLRPLVDAQVGAAPHNPLWIAGAAMAALADSDGEAARRHLQPALSSLDDIPRNEFWPALLCLYAESAAQLGDAVSAERIAAELEPWSGRFISLGMMISTLGPADFYLARLTEVGSEPSAGRAAQLGLRARTLADRIGAIAWSDRVATLR